MPIIRMGSNDDFPLGAYCPLSEDQRRLRANGSQPLVLWEEDHGLCLFEREINSYHDSDFYMEVWDEEKQEPVTKFFATTRGWSYPCYASSVDATDEVRAKYAAWKAAYDRRNRILARWRKRAERIEQARRWGMTRKEVTRILNAFPRDLQPAVDALMKVKNFRSKFRKSLAEQIRNWAAQENPRFATPLSRKQQQYL